MSEYRTVYQPNIMARQYARPQPQARHKTRYERLMHRSILLGKRALHIPELAKVKLQQTVQAVQPMKYKNADEERRYYEKNPDQIHQVVAQSHELLASATTVMLPSNIFPDTVTVDRMKVTIHEQTFFWTRNIVTLRIEDILNVSANLGLFFGSLTISTRVMNSTDHYQINGFWNSDVVKLKHIIQGYMIALHQGVDVQSLSTERLIRKLKELGSDAQPM